MLHSVVAGVASSLLLASLAQAGVLVVAPSGAPFSNVQSAIDAAFDGDTILVKPGSYAGFTIDGKSLSIVADVEGGVSLLNGIVVQNVGGGQRVSIAGLRYPAGGLRCNASLGSIRLEALETTAPVQFGFPDDALWATGCDDVAVLRCTLIGGPSFGSFPSYPGIGLRADNSRIAVYDSTVSGGKGSDAHYIGAGGSSVPALPGASGAAIAGNSQVLASGSTFTGGTGGAGLSAICFPGPVGGGIGAPGGVGLLVGGTAATYVLDGSTVGGAGGNGGNGAPTCGMPAGAQGTTGANSSGPVQQLPGPRAVLRCATHLREQNSLALTLEGQPGDQVWLRVGVATQWKLDLPFKGVQLAGPATRRLFLGSVPPSGVLQSNVFYGDLGPGIEARTWHMQCFLRDAAGNARYGSTAVFVVLDSAF